MTDQGIIDKIRKLLALAQGKGATPGEMAAAMASAQRLMTKYQIDMAALETPADEPIESVDIRTGRRRRSTWQYRLMAGLNAGASKAIVLVDEHMAAVNLYVDRVHAPKNFTMNAPSRFDGYDAGRQAGRRIPLAKGLDGAPIRKLRG